MRKFMEGYILAEKDDINAKITEDSSPDDAEKKKILRISLKMYLKHLVIFQKRNKYTIAVIILEITKLKI